MGVELEGEWLCYKMDVTKWVWLHMQYMLSYLQYIQLVVGIWFISVSLNALLVS